MKQACPLSAPLFFTVARITVNTIKTKKLRSKTSELHAHDKTELLENLRNQMEKPLQTIKEFSKGAGVNSLYVNNLHFRKKRLAKKRGNYPELKLLKCARI